MTLLLTTQTDSRYELDPTNLRIRRLTGTHAPTVRQGPDGQWRSFTAVSDHVVGEPLVVVWRVREEDGVAECLITSPVTEVRDGVALDELTESV